MAFVRSRWVPLLTLLACAGAARPQGKPGPCQAIGAALEAARSSGALERRVLRTRWFQAGEGAAAVLWEVACELTEGGKALACEVRITRAGSSTIERSELDFSGQLRRFKRVERAGEVTTTWEGELVEGKLAFQGTKVAVKWGEDVVPLHLAAFVLPCLEGLPAGLKLRVYEGPEEHKVAKAAELKVAGERVELAGKGGWVALLREGTIVELVLGGQKLAAIDGLRARSTGQALERAAPPEPARKKE